MNYEILEAINQITRDKSLDADYVVETLEAGLISAAKKKFKGENITAKMDRKTGEITMVLTRTVVDTVAEPALEVSLEEAREYEPKIKVGEELKLTLNHEDFGRNAIAAAKQVLIQRIREAEREQILEEFQGKVGELMTGSVQQIDRGNVIVNLGRAEGIMPVKEQIQKERHRQGERIRVLVLEVQKTAKGPQIILSRAHPNFLKKLFELEVPEIFEKIIEVKGVAREPGERSKIAVSSIDERIDPVGACVGIKGTRVQGIVRELSNERIDIIQWSADPETLATRALAPAKIIKIDPHPESQTMTVMVEDDSLSLAIGRAGQNARLTSKLTGWKISIVSQAEYKEAQTKKAADTSALTELSGVGAKLAESLVAKEYTTVESLAEASEADLIQIEGIGEKKAAKLVESAKKFLKKKAEAKSEE
ncbi:MAG: transcription termination factor NusA, partial [candidate division Zixibacteria bacterium]|nr:transcription termination factor NusA [candidate division Zixibacteria bacterium]